MTALLDVIFIILMVVLCNTKTVINEMQDEVDLANGDNKVTENQMDAYENIDEYISVISVYADYENNNPSTRHIRYTLNNETEIINIEVNKDNAEASYAEFINSIDEFIGAREGQKPVLLNLDDSQILHRDYVRLDEEIAILKSKYSNLYVNERNLFDAI